MSEKNKAIARQAPKEVFSGQGDLDVVYELFASDYAGEPTGVRLCAQERLWALSEELGLTEAIRKPEWKTCPLCGEKFVDDSLPGTVTRRLGFDQLDFCSPCLRDATWVERDNLSKEEVLDYL